mgnify:CR=1 FL=1|tara:strand:+ start:155 stop:970 length:816 start_codon:yes stop_codon:yes gene_type:complete
MNALEPTPKPFIKWVGSKRRLLHLLKPHLPEQFEFYYEPFLGSGSLFFELQPRAARLNDFCGELIHTYEAVRDNVQAVIKYLQPMKIDKEVYYQVRENRSNGKYKRAAEFLYLNKSCWNGLYRVNSAGKFNVPFGAPRSDVVFDRANLNAVAEFLRSSDLRFSSVDFESACSDASQNDFVFLDPPYVTKHNLNGFSEWNEKIFRWEDQTRLKTLVDDLTRRGVQVMMTNANHDSIVDLYSGYDLRTFERNSTLASNSKFRNKVDELIITNY